MENHVFISYSSRDGVALAHEVVNALEENEVACWIAPRNIPSGYDWASEIGEAIKSCRALILVVTPEINVSHEIMAELIMAANNNKWIIPYMPADATLSAAMELRLQSKQWIKAPVEFRQHRLASLAESIKQRISQASTQSVSAPTPTAVNASTNAPIVDSPKLIAETQFASMIESHFAKFPTLIPFAKHITSTWSQALPKPQAPGKFIEIYSEWEGGKVNFEDVSFALCIAPNGKDLMLVTGVYDIAGLIDESEVPIFEDWFRLIGWQGPIEANPTILDANGAQIKLDKAYGILVSIDNASQVEWARQSVEMLSLEYAWNELDLNSLDKNDPRKCTYESVLSGVATYLERSPALFELFTYFSQDICNGECLWNVKFSKNNDRFLQLKTEPNIDLYVDQVDHQSYLILRKSEGVLATPQNAESKNIEKYLRVIGWQWDILETISTSPAGEPGERRNESDLIALPIKVYDPDYRAKVKTLKQLLFDYCT